MVHMDAIFAAARDADFYYVVCSIDRPGEATFRGLIGCISLLDVLGGSRIEAARGSRGDICCIAFGNDVLACDPHTLLS